uniref:TPR_REGION domain-containing protein n=1 Tax=Rhabditophanes sp. KR3021 TaxID=114890 RepID=A0AC35UG54_9BILA
MNLLRSLAPKRLIKSSGTDSSSGGQIDDLEEFLYKRDYLGAISLLEFRLSTSPDDISLMQWLGHCSFHNADYKKAATTYLRMLALPNYPDDTETNLGVVYYFLGLYEEAKLIAGKGPVHSLTNRLLYLISFKLNDDKSMRLLHPKISGTIENEMCAAAMNFSRFHYNESINMYKKMLEENPSFLAINYYIALCLYRLDYHDASLSLLNLYLEAHPGSTTAINLVSANRYRLGTPDQAFNEIRHLSHLMDEETFFGRNLLRHNAVVYKRGQGALQVFPSLVNFIPEATHNLIIFHLKREDHDAAYAMVKDMIPSESIEYIIKAIAFYYMYKKGKSSGSDLRALTIDLYNSVGQSDVEKDTIVGRQCMAIVSFMQENYAEVCMYLQSIEHFFSKNNTFSYNYGQALVAIDNYERAEEILKDVRNDFVDNIPYQFCLIKALIHNDKVVEAEGVLKTMNRQDPSYNEALNMIANECYIVGIYHKALIFFVALRNVNQTSELNSAIRGCAVGVLRQHIAKKVGKEELMNALLILDTDKHPRSVKACQAIQLYLETSTKKEELF